MGQITSNLLKSTLSHCRHVFFSTIIAFSYFIAWAWAEIKFFRQVFRRESNQAFLRLSFFSFLSFLMQWLALYWARFKFKKLWESVLETGKFYHGVAMGSGRKCTVALSFSFNVLSIFVHLGVHWADHSDPGIIGKIFSFFRSWALMMPIICSQRWWWQKWKKGWGLSPPGTPATGVDGLNRSFDDVHVATALVFCMRSLIHSINLKGSRWQGKPFISGRSGTQYVALVTKLSLNFF